ncbi:glycoprotein [Rhodococcus rhodnii LMG 5362]|uniref:Glycoprotein n=1 Tax=Rhodococcus rhodnii LMG 5362 TaxID=1273125 RepID=R7WK23_9NOCA|nr:glycoprotein [Rhodococcus rhodnii LMG 5362]
MIGRAAAWALLVVLVTCAAVAPGLAVPTEATAAPSHTQSSQQTRSQFLRLSIDTVTPSIVTTGSERTVTVTGSVRNIGDRVVEDVAVRLQRAAGVTESSELRSSLTLDQSSFDTVGLFETLTDRLDRGQSENFSLSLPLDSETDYSLGITEPGVYPLLVNVNGTPAYGGAARLDDARFLLPVTGVPGERPDAAPAPPVATTLLWPLAAPPSLAAGVPGSLTDPVRLLRDDLADSLADGGRLDGLLAAIEATDPARSRGAWDRQLRDSTCLAIDPDLLATVEAMTTRYLVVDDAGEPDGAATEGTGTPAATEWLERLRTVAGQMCVVALPRAQADLSALATIDDPTLTSIALNEPADVVDRILGITSQRGTTWPDSGTLTPAAADLVRGAGATTSLLASTAVDTPGEAPIARIAGPTPDDPEPLDAVLFDPAVGAALAAVGSDPQTPSYVPSSVRYDLASDSETARLQDALGAVLWSSVRPDAPDGRSAVIAPPQLWSAGPDEASAILNSVTGLFRSGAATPRPLADLTRTQDPAPPPRALSAPEQSVSDGVPEHVRAAVADQLPRIDSLGASLVTDPSSPLTPTLFLAPLRGDLVRSLTLAQRRGDDPSRAETAATTRVNEVATTVDALYNSVSVVSPGGVYTLASEQSPLLLVARNDLPIGVTVRLDVQAPDGVDITDVGATALPPRGSRTLTVPARIDDSRKLVVQFALTSDEGRRFGEPISVTVRSNAYGQALAIVTACAGALLLFLAGRRLWHRFRGQPDPADDALAPDERPGYEDGEGVTSDRERDGDERQDEGRGRT